jgi:hypothetical protein
VPFVPVRSIDKPQGKVGVDNTYQLTSEEQSMIRFCRKVCEGLRQDKEPDMIDAAANSKDFRHRLAVAWYYGHELKPEENLLKLLCDENLWVRMGAREACEHIACVKYGKTVDFGPASGADVSEQADSRGLWEMYFTTREKKIKQAKEEEKLKPEPAKRSPSDILEFEKLGLEK